MKISKQAIILLVMAALTCTFLTSCRVEDDGVTIIRVALNQATNHPEYIALADFGAKFEEATDGRYKVEVYPNAVLGDQGEVTEMVRTGAIQLAVVPMSVPESYNEDFAIIAAPYLYDNLYQMETAAREGVFDELFTTVEKFGFEVVSLYTSGARHIYTDKPIRTPDDLRGYKIRVQSSDAYLQMINYMGGVGIAMGQNEVYAAVQQHVIEGAENSEVVYSNFKHYEVSPYFSYTNHLVMTDVLIANSEFLDDMDAETREAFNRIAAESMEVEFEAWDKAIDEANAVLEAEGVTFVEADIEAFRERCMPLLESIATRSKMTQRVYDSVMEIKARDEV